MRHFRATYTQYCIKHSLEPVQSRDEIIRQLRGMVIPSDSHGKFALVCYAAMVTLKVQEKVDLLIYINSS